MASCEPRLLPLIDVGLDAVAEEASIESGMARVSPALGHFTRALLHQEVWRRPDLASRDWSLATVAALDASEQTELFTLHVRRPVALGATAEQLGEALAYTVFYAGWGLARKAVLALEEVR